MNIIAFDGNLHTNMPRTSYTQFVAHIYLFEWESYIRSNKFELGTPMNGSNYR